MAADNLRQRGFTLVEAIVVIVITGIVAAMIATFIRAPVEGYVDMVRRAALTDAADTALRRIAREVRTALPNSLRAPASGSTCFEFLPTLGGGRYRAAPDSSGAGDVLDFSASDASFQVLGGVNLASALSAGNLVAVYNLGITGADAYAGNTTAAIASGSTSALVKLNPAKQFLFESPGKRFQVLPSAATVYLCDLAGGQLVRYTRGIATTPLASCPAVPAGAAVLASNVSACSFTYTSATSATARSGLLSIKLELQQGGESVRLYSEVHVDNVP